MKSYYLELRCTPIRGELDYYLAFCATATFPQSIVIMLITTLALIVDQRSSR